MHDRVDVVPGVDPCLVIIDLVEVVMILLFSQVDVCLVDHDVVVSILSDVLVVEPGCMKELMGDDLHVITMGSEKHELRLFVNQTLLRTTPVSGGDFNVKRPLSHAIQLIEPETGPALDMLNGWTIVVFLLIGRAR